MSDALDLAFTPAITNPITWVDVARRLTAIDPADNLVDDLPSGLRHVHVDWYGVTISSIDPAKNKVEVVRWLGKLFPERVTDKDDSIAIILDGPENSSKLPVELDSWDGASRTLRASLGTIEGDIAFGSGSVPNSSFRKLPVIACHSVKGGTGRTTMAIALAALWAQEADGPVLLVDADLEAPGLSYLFREARPDPQVSLEDLIALAHADGDPNRVQTIRWVAERLSSHRIGNLVVLPLRRSLDELASSAIRAEHLSSPEHPFAFADLLAEVASSAGCQGVIVDVRAGLVPLAAQLALDPQVSKVIVTSLAGQSLASTTAFVEFMSREMRRLGQRSSPPMFVVNRVPSIIRENGLSENLLEPYMQRIEASLLADRNQEVSADTPILDNDLEVAPFVFVVLSEIADLQIPSNRWQGFIDQLEATGISRNLRETFQTWLRLGPLAPSDSISSLRHPLADPGPNLTIDIRRTRLKEYAAHLVAAELAENPIDSPLVTGPMRALAIEVSQPPVIVIEGAKGTGKTLTARYLLSKGTWASAVKQITGHNSTFDALFLPVMGSILASERFQKEIDDRRNEIASRLGLSQPQSVAETRKYLTDLRQQGLSQSAWTDRWLDAIAWSTGFKLGIPGIASDFINFVRQSGCRLVAIIEGVEELYTAASDSQAGPMLRSLLTDLLLKLRSEPGRPLGLITFARRDTVDAGVSQNKAQFRTQFRDYALTWTESDVLELAAWIATASEAMNLWYPDFRRLSPGEMAERLNGLWGRKLGPDEQPGSRRVQEAYTARWVIAALSDLQGRLVARDLVRFIQYSAQSSIQSEERETYGARLLLPKAVRSAIGPTSAEKVQETEEEIEDLRAVFAKFKENNNSVLAPIDAAAIIQLGLLPEDIDLLRTHGIILGNAPPYEVPELFRMGLGLRHAGARHSVIGTQRRARLKLTQREPSSSA